MTSLLHPEIVTLRHQEMLDQSANNRRVSAAVRTRKAERLNRRAAALTARAAALVEHTSR